MRAAPKEQYELPPAERDGERGARAPAVLEVDVAADCSAHDLRAIAHFHKGVVRRKDWNIYLAKEYLMIDMNSL
jgi:hypothetical protein